MEFECITDPFGNLVFVIPLDLLAGWKAELLDFASFNDVGWEIELCKDLDFVLNVGSISVDIEESSDVTVLSLVTFLFLLASLLVDLLRLSLESPFV